MVRGPPLGASLGSDLRAQHDMETFKMELARSVGCEFSKKLIFQGCLIQNHTFWQSMESSESVLELLQSAFLLSNALIKRDHLSWSKKGEKKSCEYLDGTPQTPRGALYKKH